MALVPLVNAVLAPLHPRLQPQPGLAPWTFERSLDDPTAVGILKKLTKVQRHRPRPSLKDVSLTLTRLVNAPKIHGEAAALTEDVVLWPSILLKTDGKGGKDLEIEELFGLMKSGNNLAVGGCNYRVGGWIQGTGGRKLARFMRAVIEDNGDGTNKPPKNDQVGVRAVQVKPPEPPEPPDDASKTEEEKKKERQARLEEWRRSEAMRWTRLDICEWKEAEIQEWSKALQGNPECVLDHA